MLQKRRGHVSKLRLNTAFAPTLRPLLCCLLLLFAWSSQPLAAQKPDFPSQQAATERLLSQGRNAEALATARKAVAAESEACKKEQDPRISAAQLWLGDVCLRLKQFQEAEAAIRKALAHRQRHEGKSSKGTADAHALLAKLHLETGLGSEAEEELQAALVIYASLGTAGTLQKSQTQEQLAGLCLMAGRLSESERLYDTVLTAEALRLGDQSPELARLLNNLGGVYLAQGRHEQAQGAYAQALNLQTAAYGAEGVALATTCTNLGVLSEQIAAYEDAEKFLLRAYAIRGKHLSLADPLVLVSLDNLVSYYIKRGQFASAEALLSDAKRLREQKLGSDQPAVAEILDRFATLSMARDQADHAERYWLMALQIRENSLGPQHEYVAANLYNLGKLENVLHKNDQARIHLNWALDIYESQPLGNEAQVTAILSELFLCDYMQGQIDKAAEQLSLMRAIKTEVYGSAHPETIAVMEEQIKFYHDVQWLPQAAETEAELLKIKSK